MPEWCPRCNAMLPEGLEKCPRCGKKLHSKKGQDYSWRDILSISAYVLIIVLIPVALVIIIGLLCTSIGNLSLLTFVFYLGMFNQEKISHLSISTNKLCGGQHGF